MIEWEFTSSFKKSFKKLDKPLKKRIEKGLDDIKNNPDIGKQKHGDLCEIFIHKIKIKSQEILIAYLYDSIQGVFVAVGFHENFYRYLKR